MKKLHDLAGGARTGLIRRPLDSDPHALIPASPAALVPRSLHSAGRRCSWQSASPTVQAATSSTQHTRRSRPLATRPERSQSSSALFAQAFPDKRRRFCSPGTPLQRLEESGPLPGLVVLPPRLEPCSTLVFDTPLHRIGKDRSVCAEPQRVRTAIRSEYNMVRKVSCNRDRLRVAWVLPHPGEDELCLVPVSCIRCSPQRHRCRTMKVSTELFSSFKQLLQKPLRMPELNESHLCTRPLVRMPRTTRRCYRRVLGKGRLRC